MAEYIEREALQTALQRKKAIVADKRYTEGWNDCMMRIKSMVHSAKAADVAPVVRCGECERRTKSADLTYTIYCPWFGQQMDKTDFCSFGERMDDDGT